MGVPPPFGNGPGGRMDEPGAQGMAVGGPSDGYPPHFEHVGQPMYQQVRTRHLRHPQMGCMDVITHHHFSFYFAHI